MKQSLFFLILWRIHDQPKLNNRNHPNGGSEEEPSLLEAWRMYCQNGYVWVDYVDPR
jgi:hypothetical protein